MSADIGKPIVPGRVEVNPVGLWQLSATNGDIGTLPKRLDNFFYVHQPLTGDGSVLASIIAQEGGDSQWAKAGVMIREGTGVGARNVLLGMTTGHGLLITYRPIANKSTLDEGANLRYGTRRFPTWLRLQREGDRVTPFASPDGLAWTQLHSPIVLPGFAPTALAGVALAGYTREPTTTVFNLPIVVSGYLSPIVRACAGNGQVLLSWPTVQGAIGYVIRRSVPTALGIAADPLTPAPIRETSFYDTNLVNGKPLRYLVSAVFEQEGQPVEGWPTSVPVTPVGVPGELFGCDINLEATQMRGAVGFDPASTVYKIAGSGGDIGGREDRFYYAARWVTGDFQITARILDRPSRTSAGAKAGLMVRETLEGPSRAAFLAATSLQGLALWQRGTTGANARWPAKPLITEKRLKLPLFLRLVRQGATVAAFLSNDGVRFTPAGKLLRFDPPLPESVYVGYAVTAQNAGAFSTSTFSDLVIE